MAVKFHKKGVNVKSDKHFYMLFEAWPEALEKVVHLRHSEYRFSSKTIKEIERRIDGWLESAEEGGPRYIIEFEMWSNPRVYHMVVQAMAGVYLDDLSRPVFGRILFRTRSLDLKTQPWSLLSEARAEALQVHYLDEELAALELTQPGHPLISVLRPVVIQNWDELEKYSARDYHCIQTAELPLKLKEKLSDLFLDWIVQLYRMAHPEKEQDMLDLVTQPETTNVYRDLVARFKKEFESQGEVRGEARGVALGEVRGEARGEIKTLNLLYERGLLSKEHYEPLVAEARKKLEQC